MLAVMQDCPTASALAYPSGARASTVRKLVSKLQATAEERSLQLSLTNLELHPQQEAG